MEDLPDLLALARRVIAPAREHIPVQVQNRNPGRPVPAVRWLHERKQRRALSQFSDVRVAGVIHADIIRTSKICPFTQIVT